VWSHNTQQAHGHFLSFDFANVDVPIAGVGGDLDVVFVGEPLMLNGITRPPAGGGSWPISADEPQPPSQLEPSLSPEWDDIIRRALARNPALRYQSAEEFLDDIAQLDQASIFELPLKQSKLAIGIAVLGSVVLAFAASPAFDRLRTVPPEPAPSHRLHIMPPDFATSIAPPPLAKPEEVPRSKRVVHFANTRVVEPHPVAETSNNGRTAPIARPSQDGKEPSATESADSGASEAGARMKRSVWTKLNVFKKKRSIDPNENQ